ncbi:hypothetical protein C8R46DRAFT_1062644 [Mycena filopes]|nr:hypothetical protein C8R46DRAFT_1062644 [Mycena filopes]
MSVYVSLSITHLPSPPLFLIPLPSPIPLALQMVARPQFAAHQHPIKTPLRPTQVLKCTQLRFSQSSRTPPPPHYFPTSPHGAGRTRSSQVVKPLSSSHNSPCDLTPSTVIYTLFTTLNSARALTLADSLLLQATQGQPIPSIGMLLSRQVLFQRANAVFSSFKLPDLPRQPSLFMVACAHTFQQNPRNFCNVQHLLPPSFIPTPLLRLVLGTFFFIFVIPLIGVSDIWLLYSILYVV